MVEPGFVWDFRDSLGRPDRNGLPMLIAKEGSLYTSEEKGRFDELVKEKGVKVLIDLKALMHVIGNKMNYVDDPLRYGL
jgi:hypothetical protein